MRSRSRKLSAAPGIRSRAAATSLGGALRSIAASKSSYDGNVASNQWTGIDTYLKLIPRFLPGKRSDKVDFADRGP
jgi:hypothetical protein